MATEAELTQTINSLQKSYEDAKDDNNEIQAQIEALEEALSWVKLAEKHAESLERSVGSIKVSSKWVKAYRDGFDAALRGSLKQSTANYENDVRALKESIQNKIWQLELEKNHLVSFFSTIEKRIGEVFKELAEVRAS